MAEHNDFPAEWGQELSLHTIESVQSYTLRARYPRLMGIGAREEEWGYGRLMKIYVLRTQSGHEGWGLVPATAGEGTTLIGRTLSSLVTPGEGVHAAAKSAEFPLLDLCARILGLPAYRLLGTAVSVSLPCYDGSILMQDMAPLSRPGGAKGLLDAVSQDWDAGYRTFRLAMGRGFKWLSPQEGLLRDAAMLQMLQAHFPDAGFMADFPTHDGVYLEQFLRATLGMRLIWIEIPLKDDREGYAALREMVQATHPEAQIVVSQSSVNTDIACRFLQEGLLDGIHPDVTALGPTKLLKLSAKIRETGGFLSPGCYGNPLKQLYAAHIAALSTAVHSLEGVNATLEGISPEGFAPIHGEFLLPEDPGFGADFVWGMKSVKG